MRTDKQSNYPFSVWRRRSISRVPTAGGWESTDSCASFGAFHQRKPGSDRSILPCACTGAGLRERGREKGGGIGGEKRKPRNVRPIKNLHSRRRHDARSGGKWPLRSPTILCVPAVFDPAECRAWSKSTKAITSRRRFPVVDAVHKYYGVYTKITKQFDAFAWYPHPKECHHIPGLQLTGSI